MNEQEQSLADLQHIKKMMERSSRFISLSGLSGIGAGLCALVGAVLAYPYVYQNREIFIDPELGLMLLMAQSYEVIFNTWLFWIAAGTFSAALLVAFAFTFIRSRKEGIPIWGSSARRLLLNVFIPLVPGGLLLLRLIEKGMADIIAPVSLIFYGLALINAARYTLGEIKYLGYGQLLLGMINLWFPGYGLYFWAMGFGVLHMTYGAIMWFRYERNPAA